MSPHYLHYFLIFCAFSKNSKNGELTPNCGKYRVNIILGDKTLQYLYVPIAYQIQQIIY